MTGMSNEHLSAEVLQAFLEGDLPSREGASVERHVGSCARCGSELEVWRSLFSELNSLPSPSPREGFQDRVMADVRIPAPLPLAARIRNRIVVLLPGRADGHISVDRLQGMLEGLVQARQVARIEAHLSSCGQCASDADSWRSVFATLDRLPRLEPGERFADRVMAGMRMPAAVAASVRVPAWQKAAAWAGKLVPQTRTAWAAISGIAVAPAVTAGLVFSVLVSHPTLTPGSLAAYAWWQFSDVVSAGWAVLSGLVAEIAQASGALSLFDGLAAAPLVVAAGVLLYVAASALALRVLYKHVYANHPLDGRYAQVSAS
jgi:anti-sigma factor RsiW